MRNCFVLGVFLFLGVVCVPASAQMYWSGDMAVSCDFGYLFPNSSAGDEMVRCHYFADNSTPPPVNTEYAIKQITQYGVWGSELSWNPLLWGRRTIVGIETKDYDPAQNFETGIGTPCFQFAVMYKTEGMALYIDDAQAALKVAARDTDWGFELGDPNCVGGTGYIEKYEMQPDYQKHPTIRGQIFVPDENGNGYEERILILDGFGIPSGEGADSDWQIFIDCPNFVDCRTWDREDELHARMDSILGRYFEDNSAADSVGDDMGYDVSQNYGAIVRYQAPGRGGDKSIYSLMRFEIGMLLSSDGVVTYGIDDSTLEHSILLAYHHSGNEVSPVQSGLGNWVMWSGSTCSGSSATLDFSWDMNGNDPDTYVYEGLQSSNMCFELHHLMKVDPYQ